MLRRTVLQSKWSQQRQITSDSPPITTAHVVWDVNADRHITASSAAGVATGSRRVKPKDVLDRVSWTSCRLHDCDSLSLCCGGGGGSDLSGALWLRPSLLHAGAVASQNPLSHLNFPKHLLLWWWRWWWWILLGSKETCPLPAHVDLWLSSTDLSRLVSILKASIQAHWKR